MTTILKGLLGKGSLGGMLTNIINGLKRLYAGILKPAVYLFSPVYFSGVFGRIERVLATEKEPETESMTKTEPVTDTGTW